MNFRVESIIAGIRSALAESRASFFDVPEKEKKKRTKGFFGPFPKRPTKQDIFFSKRVRLNKDAFKKLRKRLPTGARVVDRVKVVTTSGKRQDAIHIRVGLFDSYYDPKTARQLKVDRVIQ